MLPEFKSTLSSHLESLEEALKENNPATLIRAVHTIKGAFLNLGLSECAKIALDIERGARISDESLDYHALVASLREIVNDILNE